MILIKFFYSNSNLYIWLDRQFLARRTKRSRAAIVLLELSCQIPGSFSQWCRDFCVS